ncbi:MAG: MmcQ/YjbR family DNA-binding protein [Candidatus Hydrogenedentota bacterium]
MSAKQLERVRRICAALPGTTEKISHGEPTFFVGKKVYVMFSNNHHGDGHVAVCVSAPLGSQEVLIEASPQTFYRPPYVGVRGWIGIELAHINDKDLTSHIHEAWRMIAPKKLLVEAGAVPEKPKKAAKHR